MYYDYKIFILNKLVALSLKNEILLISLVFFAFLILFSILYNIYIYFNKNLVYKLKLIKLEKNLINLNKLYTNGKIDAVLYKKRIELYQQQIKNL